MNNRRWWNLVGTILTGLCWGHVQADEVSFNRDIRPILSDNCFACHGPDKHGRKADLRLDDRQTAIDTGAIQPGKHDASSLVERILSPEEDTVMPPASSGKKLTNQQKELLKRWIDQGAAYEIHWSFIPVPEVVNAPTANELSDWATSELDRFVAAKLIDKGLRPAPQTSKAQWLRRVTLDLTGLPPTLEELNSFEQDTAPESDQRVVDRLLKSEAYGERMASMWLDVARYADTFGYQSDVPMEVWPWRDWVIKAFNENLPYDQFVTWQTAGDLLPNATMDQKLATAFNRLHRQTNEGGSVVEEFRIANIADRTTTNGTAFLGLTMECSRCHDHKYDPIRQNDFYRLSAYFSNIDELGVYAHFTMAAPTPALLLYREDQEAKHSAALADVAQAESKWRTAVDSATKRFSQERQSQERQSQERQSQKSSSSWPIPAPPSPDFHLSLDGDRPGVVGNCTYCDGDEEIKVKDAPDFGRSAPFSIGIWVKPALAQPRMMVLHQSVAAEDSAFRGLQLTLDDGHPEFSLIHFWPGNAVRVEAIPKIPVGEWTHLAITHDGSGLSEGLRLFINGKRIAQNVERDQLTRDFKHRKEWRDSNAGTVRFAIGARFRDIGFRDGLVDDLQIFKRELTTADVAAMFAAANTSSDRFESTEPMRIEHLVANDEEVRKAAVELMEARRNENEVVTGVREIMTMRTAVLPRESHILLRGEYHALGERVDAGTPGLFSESAQGQDRLALANWLVSPKNPLVSRVIVNRFWHLFFGRGIVASLEDFGSQGVPPSHPELLDYLARTLMNDGWDLKQLCRRIVLSATYRQSSKPIELNLLESDPANVWLARGPKHRLSAEQVRDVALAASGLLVRKLGGPSVMPYQPSGLWEEAGTGKSYQQATGEGLYRRSLYTFWKRTSPPPSMLNFDATSRETCTPKRELTTTPLQALVLLNDPQYVEASRVLAEQLVKNNQVDTGARWVEAYRRLVTRSPSALETSIMETLYQRQFEYFNADPVRAVEFLKVGERKADESLPANQLAATAVVVEMLLSYDETMMKR
ncbi:MAG: DUF1553 domain-containing protein [Pirellula sp.]